MSTLEERFEQSDSPTIEVDGRQVVQLFRLPVDDGTTLSVEFVSVGADRPQGVNLSLRGGALEIEGERHEDIVLWRDTAPDETDVACRLDDGEGELHVWNAWRGAHDANQAWIGNSGIVVEEQGRDSVLLRCSDGDGEPDFDDLVVRLRWDRSG